MQGEFRTSQNWIGGASLNDARFIPPVHNKINNLMSDLEKFAHNESLHLPILIQAAIIHYQFETIHPFLDGNGRVGRLLITLYLVGKEIIKKPILYLSDFFERNRQLYYDNLMNVRKNNDMTQWLKFFLVGVLETAKNGVITFEKILNLKRSYEELIQSKDVRVSNLLRIMDYLYQKPIIDVKIVKKVTGVTDATANKILGNLEEYRILKEITGGQRDRKFMFYEYIKLF